ncbi:tyrosine-type recombinase/integrase [Streptomyces sp. NPDC005071]
MTVAAVPLEKRRRALETAEPQIAVQWEEWLRDAIDPRWRPNEWDGDQLLFTGDVHNPRTSVRLCVIRGCGMASVLKKYCGTCVKYFRRSGLTSKEFEATFVAQRNRRYDQIARCAIPGCVRDNSSLGMCRTHYQAWRNARNRQPGLELNVWVLTQRPYDALPRCLVKGCCRDQVQRSRLCVRHGADWRNESPGTGDPIGIEEWAERQTPCLSAHMFSLAPLTAVARLEVLLTLQRRDGRDQNILPKAVRGAVTRLASLHSIALAGDAYPDYSHIRETNLAALMRELKWSTSASFDEFRGIDPSHKTYWDLRVVSTVIPSLRAPESITRKTSVIDFAAVQQDWLRDLVMHWARTANPDSHTLRVHYKASVIASKALALRSGGGTDPETLQFSDMTAMVEAFKQTRRDDGEIASNRYQRQLLNAFFDLLDFGRLEGILDALSPRFVRHKSHKIKPVEENEDEIGKALPESVIRQMDQAVHLLGEGMVYGEFSPHVVNAMFRTAYVILRDTGRRTKEVARLALDCLEYDEGEYQLVWDNTKGRRLRRRLPLYSETVEAIREWKEIRAGLNLPSRSTSHLFPAITDRHRHIERAYISRSIRVWADSIPVLLSDELGPDGTPLPFDRERIFPYAFRHTFCQRYADAGVAPHVLQALMDHKSADTTAAYYRVSAKMKREAMDVLRLQSVDRHGRAAPMASEAAYELRSVAVPFGNCIEPSNVKAGGRACPIRFQCSGCSSYRPDPSHLPAIEDQVRALKANLELARLMGTADWTITGMEGEIGDYLGVIEKMKARMERMSDEERREVQEASRTLRRLRAGASTSTGPVALPMPVVRRVVKETP